MPASKIVEKLQTYGLGTASPVDLAAIGFSRREEDVDAGEGAAKQFIKAGHRLLSVNSAAGEDVKRFFGLEGYEALRALALLELGRRTAQVGKGPISSITSPEDVYRLLQDELRDKRQEFFYAVLVDSKNNVLKKTQIHVGTLTASLVGPREVYREAIREGASALIVAHNHPSGDPTPSPEDVEVTRRLRAVGEMLDIPLLDHVIVGDERWTSPFRCRIDVNQEWTEIVDGLRAEAQRMHEAREGALARCRLLIQTSAKCIRHLHRGQFDEARVLLQSAKDAATAAREPIRAFPEIYYAGYLQDAEKELVEAAVVLAMIVGEPFPRPAELGVGLVPFLHGLGEAASEVRRYALDELRKGRADHAEAILLKMEIIYDDLITFDFPDGMTGGLRRTTDALRAVIERTRSDLTATAVQHRLIQELEATRARLPKD